VAWVFACHQRNAAEVNGTLGAADTMVVCPVCSGLQPARDECTRCEGIGAIDKPPPHDSPPPAAIECAPVLRAWALIRRYGIQGWMVLEGIEAGDVAADFTEHLAIVEVEYARLEHQARVEEAAKQRRKK
jgi:hypothetical protein